MDIVAKVANGELPRDSAIETVLVAFPTIDQRTAERLIPEERSAQPVPDPDMSVSPDFEASEVPKHHRWGPLLTARPYMTPHHKMSVHKPSLPYD